MLSHSSSDKYRPHGIFLRSSKEQKAFDGLYRYEKIVRDNFEQYGYFHCPKCSQWYRDQTQLQCLGMVFTSFIERIHTHLKEVSI